MSSFTYGFVNARVGALKSHLLSSTEMKSLIESRNFDDALALLKNTAYAKGLSKLSSSKVIEIENVFSMSLNNDYEKLAISVSGIPKTFLAHFAKKLEIDALKTLFIMKSKGEDVKKYPWILQSTSGVQAAEKLVEMGSPEEMVEMLRFSKYYEALHKAVPECSEQGTAFPFISALDSYYYGELGKIIRKMKGKDRGIVEHLIGIEIDAKNLLTALRIRDTEEKEILKWLIPIRYHLTDPELISASNTRALSELQQILKYYADIVSKSAKECDETQSLFRLEQEFKRYIIKENNRIFAGDRFHLGSPLAYLNLKENEIRNLTAILQGKEEGLPASEIKETVILLT